MPPPFEFHEVADGLWVGPCPSSPERIRGIRERGIHGLVSVQTDGDLAEMGLSWTLMWRFLVAQGFASQRQAIVDFDDRALLEGLDRAVAAVHDLRQGSRSVYLHCTAGVNRSPTVAIAYLIAHHGHELDAAWEQVTTRRPCAPNRTVLERWVARRPPPG